MTEFPAAQSCQRMSELTHTHRQAVHTLRRPAHNVRVSRLSTDPNTYTLGALPRLDESPAPFVSGPSRYQAQSRGTNGLDLHSGDYRTCGAHANRSQSGRERVRMTHGAPSSSVAAISRIRTRLCRQRPSTPNIHSDAETCQPFARMLALPVGGYMRYTSTQRITFRSRPRTLPTSRGQLVSPHYTMKRGENVY